MLDNSDSEYSRVLLHFGLLQGLLFCLLTMSEPERIVMGFRCLRCWVLLLSRMSVSRTLNILISTLVC